MGHWEVSFTTPEANISRNNSQRTSHRVMPSEKPPNTLHTKYTPIKHAQIHVGMADKVHSRCYNKRGWPHTYINIIDNPLPSHYHLSRRNKRTSHYLVCHGEMGINGATITVRIPASNSNVSLRHERESTTTTSLEPH